MERQAYENHKTGTELFHHFLHSGIGKALVVFALFLTSLTAAAATAAAGAAAVIDWFFLFIVDHTDVFVTSGQEDEDDHVETHQASKQEEFVGLDRQLKVKSFH